MCVTQSPSITKHSGSKLVDDIEIAFGNALGFLTRSFGKRFRI